MNKNSEPKRSAASWLMELAEGQRGEYALSILAALLGVACSLIPYFIIIKIITALVNGTAELTQCLTLCAWMALCWVLRYVLHSVSWGFPCSLSCRSAYSASWPCSAAIMKNSSVP